MGTWAGGRCAAGPRVIARTTTGRRAAGRREAGARGVTAKAGTQMGTAGGSLKSGPFGRLRGIGDWLPMRQPPAGRGPQTRGSPDAGSDRVPAPGCLACGGSQRPLRCRRAMLILTQERVPGVLLLRANRLLDRAKLSQWRASFHNRGRRTGRTKRDATRNLARPHAPSRLPSMRALP